MHARGVYAAYHTQDAVYPYLYCQDGTVCNSYRCVSDVWLVVNEAVRERWMPADGPFTTPQM